MGGLRADASSLQSFCVLLGQGEEKRGEASAGWECGVGTEGLGQPKERQGLHHIIIVDERRTQLQALETIRHGLS